MIAPLLAFAGVISFCQTTSLDIWWHLKTGEWIWQQHRIPRVDPFSFTAAGKPWIAHEWLFGLVAFLIHRTAGLAGLIGAKALIVAGVVALAAWVARSRGATAGMTLLVLTASYAIARLRLTERPESISLLLAVAFLLVHEKSKDRQPLLLLLPALQLLWVNIHGGTALLGWFLAGGFLLDHVRQLSRRGSSWLRILLRKELSWNVGTFVGVVAVSFVNPNTIQTLGYGLLRSESPLNNEEFQSLSRSFGRSLELAMAVFIIYAALIALLFVLRPRSVRIYEWLLLPSLVILSLLFFRFRILFAFLLAPSLAWHLSQGKLLSRVRWWLPALVSLALLFQIAIFERNSFTYRFGAGAHTGIFPVGATEFVKRSGLSGHMFNPYGFGGYLIWSLAPEFKVFIDGREDVYVKPGVVREYLDCFRSSERWQQLTTKYGIDFAIVGYPETPPPSPEASLEQLAFPRSEWALVYFDEIAVIYARRNGKNEEVIRQKEIKTVQPLQLSVYLDAILKDPEKQNRFLEEMNTNLREHPSAYRDHLVLGIFAIKRGPAFFPQAIQEFQQAAALDPEYASAYFNLGNVFMQLGRISEARQAFEKALELTDSPVAAQQLSLIQGRR